MCDGAGMRPYRRSPARRVRRIASLTLGRAVSPQARGLRKVPMDQSLGARRREISTSLRTKTVESCRVENALWRIVAAGSLPADSAADGAREARGEPISAAMPHF
ncbi:hypothetical protein X947_5430 [Burkholderia pseudomallei MSHR7334]|nr:hypothetical protein X948_5239 [Burkholderia pseudomallei MSHR5608]KGS75163.1 hypothetical protein X947_5430 [Burkholderia pseudomallei MSHR7334]